MPDQRTIILLNICLLGVLALRLCSAWQGKKSLYALGLLVTSMAYLAAWYSSGQLIPLLARAFLYLAITMQPVFFWLLAMEFFDDRFALRWYHYVAIASKPALAFGLMYGQPQPDLFTAGASIDYPRLLPNFFVTLAFVIHAMAVILRTGAQDLVERRRKLRRLVLAGTGLLILQAIIAAAVLRPMGLSDFADRGSLIAITLATVAILAWGDTFWRSNQAPSMKNAASDADPEIVRKAIDAMEVDEHFRIEGLTVSLLAEKIGVPDYKLRRAINSGLGYRNFNEYLNHYRIKEARRFLEIGENDGHTLLHLALDLGYPAPGPFNRAFREATGVTPTEYRRARNQKS